jgi:hypothetical protein
MVFLPHLLQAQISITGGVNNDLAPVRPDTVVQVAADSQGLPLVLPEQVPASGTFWWVMPGGMAIPTPCPPQDLSGAIYQIADGQFLVDETGGQIVVNQRRLGLQVQVTSSLVALAAVSQADALVNLITQVQTTTENQASQTRLLASSMDVSGPPTPGDGSGSGGTNSSNGGTGYVMPDYGTNLWIAQVAVTSGNLTGIGTNTQAYIQYDILSRTNLLQTDWQTENSIFGSETTNWTSFSVAQNNRTNLFIRLRSDASSDGSGLPDWWELEYFGTNGVDPYGNPAGDGYGNLQKFQNGMNPNVFYTPAAPQGLTVKYNANNGTAKISWLASSGQVTGYTVTDSDGYTFNFSASTLSTTLNVSSKQPDPWSFGTIPTTYTVQAHYTGGNSVVSGTVPLEAPSFAGIISAGPQDEPVLTVRAMPINTTGIRLTEIDVNAINWRVGTVFVTNFTVPIGNVTNYNTTIPNIETPNQDEFCWVGQAVGADGSLSAAAYLNDDFYMTSGNYVVASPVINSITPPFYDGRMQMKQNLIFQLRAAGGYTSFQYADYDPANDYRYGVVATPTNYAYGGFYVYVKNSNQQQLNPFRPYLENNIYRNFVFSPADVDVNGNLDTGASADRMTLLYAPVKYEFQLALNDFSAKLSANESRWLLYDASGISDNGSANDDNPYTIGLINNFLDDNQDAYDWTINSNFRNWFGLPYISANLAIGNAVGTGVETNVFFAGQTFTSADYAYYNPIYLETAQPMLQTVEYDFWNPLPTWDAVALQTLPADALPGDPEFSPSNLSRQFFASVGSQIRIAGYAKLAVINSAYTDVFGYLGQYFDAAYKVDANGSVTSTNTGVLSPYGNFLATEPGTVALVTMPDIDTGERGTCMVYSVSLQVDKNHDGTMDTSFNGPDATSQASPMIAWVNNGHILPGSNGNPDLDVQAPPASPNYAVGQITCQRDLENFFRLWICGLPSLPANQGYSVSMSFQNISGNPAVNLYWSCETNGGTGYLTGTNTASDQINGGYFQNRLMFYGNYIGTVSNNLSYAFPDGTFSSGGTKYLLFEGAGIGSGQLVLTISQNGTAIAQTGVWLDLHDIKDLYERAHIANLANTFPAMINNLNASTFVSDHELATSPTETNQLIVFIHGWRMGMFDYLDFSDTMFKRLYWQGYHGRFASLRWPTLSADDYRVLSDTQSYTTYNRSEYVAHRSAEGASAYFDWLKARLPDYSINAVAHSMGNIVMMETLKLQLAAGSGDIDNYVMMQAAVPAHCYDTSLPDYSLFTAMEVNSPTPDVYRGFPGNITAAVNGQIVNFFNTNDYALTTGTWGIFNVSWEGNEVNYKPDGPWDYSSDGTNCFENNVVFRTVTDPREQMAFVARPRSKAAGAQPDVGGVIQGGQLDLKANYGFDIDSHDHSAEFNWNIQQLGGTNGFYRQLGASLGVFPVATP